MTREQKLEKALAELLVAVEFGGLIDLGAKGQPNMGYKAYIPDTFVTNAKAALQSRDGQ